MRVGAEEVRQELLVGVPAVHEGEAVGRVPHRRREVAGRGAAGKRDVEALTCDDAGEHLRWVLRVDDVDRGAREEPREHECAEPAAC